MFIWFIFSIFFFTYKRLSIFKNSKIFFFQSKEDINLDSEEMPLSYECEKKPLKMNASSPGEVDYLCDLFKGRFNVTANVNHGGKISTVKVFDKSDPEGDEAAKREFKNLKTLRHEKMVCDRNSIYLLDSTFQAS